MKNKFSLVVLLVLAISVSGCSLFKKKKVEETPQQKSLINQPVNLISVDQRPYLSLVPQNDGRKIDLQINQLNKPATEAEFELEYTSGTLIQGAFGSIDLASGEGEYEVLLGSCSAGGTCTYHQEITGGEMIVSFKGEEDYAVKVPWRYQESAIAKGNYGTRDQRFQISGTNLFSNSKIVIVMETSGLPVAVEGEILAGPYGVFPSNGLAKDPTDATVTLRLTDEVESATLWGYDGSNWVEIESELDGKSLTAQTQPYQVFVVTQ